MKKIFLLLSLSAVLFSCAEDDTTPVIQNTNSLNKVLLLKVDLDTYEFEGGKEIVFPESGAFTIETEIQPLFINNETGIGNYVIKYSELDETIFDGDIPEDGPALVNFPQNFDSGSSFSLITDAVEMPDLSMFEQIPLDLYLIAPDNMGTHYPLIWDSLNNLQIVEEYRESNPDAKVYVFQFGSHNQTNQTETEDSWKWYVLLKN